jgi:hypothetical protein
MVANLALLRIEYHISGSSSGEHRRPLLLVSRRDESTPLPFGDLIEIAFRVFKVTPGTLTLTFDVPHRFNPSRDEFGANRLYVGNSEPDMEPFVGILRTGGLSEEFKLLRPHIENDVSLTCSPFPQTNHVTIIPTLRFQVFYDQTNPRRPVEQALVLLR